MDTVGRRNTEPRAPIPSHVTDAWNRAIGRLLDIPRAPKSSILTLSEEAETLFTAYRGYLEPLIPAEGPGMQGWLAKLAGTVLRIASQFHLIRQELPQEVPISKETMRSAITLGGYFHCHARVMFRMMHNRDGQSDAAGILEVLQKHDTESISRRNLWRKMRGRAAYAQSSDLLPALGVLEDAGWIRCTKVRDGGSGRYSETIYLHPEIHGQNGQNPSHVVSRGDSVHFVHLSEEFQNSQPNWI
jgi:hypothetical protein